MKRMWIGAGLLAVLLAAGLLVGAAVEARICPGARQLRQAGDAALAGDWKKAEALTDTVRADWERTRQLAALLSTHEELEQIGSGLDQLPAYAGTDAQAYSAICATLARQLEAMGQSHRCSLENLF